MAEASLHTQDLCQCPVCLDPLNDPVTIPCGHSYCINCISDCWNQEDQKGVYSCPQCRETFSPRPVLKKNTMLAELVGKLKTAETQEVFSAPCLAGPGDVECDFCTERKLKAVKSCLVCLASFCETHVQPHYKSAAFKKHKLVQVSAQLQEKICDQHDRLFDVFCRTDQKCICMLCTIEEHKGHDTVSASAERNDKQIKLEEARKKSSQQIQGTEKDLIALRKALVAHKDLAGKAVKQSEIFFRDLIKSVENYRSEVIKLIRDQEKAAVGQAEKVIKDLEQEIAEKRKGLTQLDQLSHAEDHVHFLQSYQTLHLADICKDLPSVTFSPNLSFEDPGPTLSALKQKVEKLLLLQMEEMTKQVGAERRSFVTTDLTGDEILPMCMPCGHAFCTDCLTPSMGFGNCPVCKKSNTSVPLSPDTQTRALSSDIKEVMGVFTTLKRRLEREASGKIQHGSRGTSIVRPAISGSNRGKGPKPGCKEGAGARRGPHVYRILPGDTGEKEERCTICKEFVNKKKFPCGHGFCSCLGWFVENMGEKCPVCTEVYRRMEGNQPDGQMTTKAIGSSLPGFGRCGTIVINYSIPSGIQTNKHPRPGRPFYGTNRTAYLPDNKEGKEVLALLRRAFDQRLIFTVGTLQTVGSDNCVIWNGISHKINTNGGLQSYPDDTYLKKVREELKGKGIE